MKNKDPLLFNKILSAFLIGGLVLMSSKYIIAMVYHPEIPAEVAYKIEVPEDTGGTAVADVVIEPILERMKRLSADAQAAAKVGTRLFKKCVSCHTVDSGGKNKVGPNLWNIVGGEAGKKEGFAYSANLPKVGAWTFENLDAYLTKPNAFVKGTKMSFAGLKKPDDRAAVILYLQSLSDSPVEIE